MSKLTGWQKLRRLPYNDPRRVKDRAYHRARMQQFKAAGDPRYLGNSSPEKARARFRRGALMRAFGIDETDYAFLLETQHGVCAICGLPEKRTGKGGRVKALAVDHNHDTGAIRGLLCHDCNVALGLLKEDRTRIASLVAYLDLHS